MALPINPQTNTPNVTPQTLTDEEQIIAIANRELELLAQEIPGMRNYRSYYDGEQALVFGTQKFKDEFGDAFDNWRDNWCGVVIDAVMDKLFMEGLIIPDESTDNSTPEDINTDNDSLASRIWEVLSRNDVDEQQKDLYESALVEGRSGMLVWPDPELGARVDWQPGELIRVRYSDDDWRLPVLAVKRWVTASGTIRVNVYTRTFVYKFFQQAMEVPTAKQRQRRSIPDTTTASKNLERYEVPGEEWPLPNPLGEIPIVEFVNKRGSELDNVIPLQDAINYLAIQSFVSGEFGAYQQRVFFTAANEPDGGWSNHPGKVWKVPPTYDADGKPHYGQMGEFSSVELSGYRGQIEMFLQHAAHITKTPVRFFFKSDRGGRGDAPSGESLLIEDEPLLEKVEDRQVRFGNSWWRVFRLIAKCLSIAPEPFPVGEVTWEDIRSKYRASLLEEAKVMFEIGIPIQFIITKLGFRPEELAVLSKMLEEKEAEDEARREEEMAMQAAQAEARTDANANNASSSTPE